jgi:hypothetical protein
MSGNTLVFSIALNGYQWLYKHCIESHKRYALAQGYKYEVVTYPAMTAVGVECCWLKLTLLKAALEAGYETVCFIDADALVKPHTPAFETTFEPGKYLYLAKSYSERFNSGVIIVRNHHKIRLWVDQVIARRHLNVERQNDVCWGENGHIIQQTQQCTFVSTLDSRWNNTYDKTLDDYIRHFNHGPLRESRTLKTIHFLLSRTTRLLTKTKSLINKYSCQKVNDDPLQRLTGDVLTHYSSFHRL